MLDIALVLILTRDDDGQTMLFANAVAGTAYFVIAALVGMVVLVILKTDCIENQVVMNVILVYVGGEYKLVLATQYFFCQLHPDFMGFIGGNIPRLKGLDQVPRQIGALVDGMSAGPGKLTTARYLWQVHYIKLTLQSRLRAQCDFWGALIAAVLQSVRAFRVSGGDIFYLWYTLSGPWRTSWCVGVW